MENQPTVPVVTTKAQALDIFVQLATAFRATPAEHALIKSALEVIAALPEPAKPE